MARPKKDATKVVAQIDVSKEVVQNTTQELLKKFEELQKQLTELKAENNALKDNTQVEDNDNTEELTSDTDITVISQTVGNGIGTVYRFEEFGEVQDIPFGDLKDIVKNKPRFAKEGAYFICNPQAVKKLRLGNQYKNLIDDKTFINLFDKDAKTIVALYESAPKMQQEQVVSLIQDRLDNGLEVDGNVLIKIGQLCGRDFITKE